MLQILIVDDSPHKQSRIKEVVSNCSDIRQTDIKCVSNIKDAKRLLYDNYFDLMILDLVLPIETGLDADAKNGAQFLEEINMSPSLKPPIHIVGISEFSEKVTQYHEQFSKKLWNLIDYRANSEAWQDQLKSILFHLVKTRERFIKHSVQKNIFDVAIITALPAPEFQAVLKLGGVESWESVKFENEFITFYKNKFIKGDIERTIIAATSDQMGMPAASHLATKMILYFRPQYLIMTGIAAGTDSNDFGFGDVLIAEQAWDYGSGKVSEVTDVSGKKETLFLPDPKDIQLCAELKAKVNSFKLTKSSLLTSIQDEWRGELPKTKLQMHLGQIGSGSGVISSKLTVEDIKKQKRKMIGIDMETYGVYYASEHSPEPKTKSISIKSVSDYADGQKNDKFQQYAAYTSAAFAYHFILNEL